MRSSITWVYYCLGLARNSRLWELLEAKFALVHEIEDNGGFLCR